MKGKFIWFAVGVGCLALVLGIFIGASNSPVAGVMISGLFGIVVAVIGIIADKNGKEGQTAKTKIDIHQAGKVVTIFSALILLGAFIGVTYRTHVPAEPVKFFVWDDKEAPTSTYEALDWITVSEMLLQKGFSAAKVKSLYDIRLNELGDTANEEQAGKYSEAFPYSKMLGITPSKEPKRGLASE